MTELTIRNLPDAVRCLVRVRASQSGRSLEEEVVACLEAFFGLDEDADTIIERRKQLWEDLGAPDIGPLDPDWKRWGRA